MQSALVVIDVQEGLFRPEPRPGSADRVVARINGLADRARREGVPVIFVQHESADELPFDSPAWQLVGELDAAVGDHRIRKTTCDSFLRTELAELLTRLGARHLILCGYATEYCLDTTARRALGLGYDVTVVADAHTTHDAPYADAELIVLHHNRTFTRLDSFGVRTAAIKAEEIVWG